MRFVCSMQFAGLLLAQTPSYQPVASSKQIMAVVQKPAMDALAAMRKAGGPKDDKEWEVAGQNAAVLAETAQLLLLGTRPLDQEVWLKASQRLYAGAAASVKAVESRELAAWESSLNTMGAACRSCHNVHRKDKDKEKK